MGKGLIVKLEYSLECWGAWQERGDKGQRYRWVGLRGWGDVFGERKGWGAVISLKLLFCLVLSNLYAKSPTPGCGPGSAESPRLCAMSPHSDVPILPHHPNPFLFLFLSSFSLLNILFSSIICIVFWVWNDLSYNQVMVTR